MHVIEVHERKNDFGYAASEARQNTSHTFIASKSNHGIQWMTSVNYIHTRKTSSSNEFYLCLIVAYVSKITVKHEVNYF